MALSMKQNPPKLPSPHKTLTSIHFVHSLCLLNYINLWQMLQKKMSQDLFSMSKWTNLAKLSPWFPISLWHLQVPPALSFRVHIYYQGQTLSLSNHNNWVTEANTHRQVLWNGCWIRAVSHSDTKWCHQRPDYYPSS